MKRNRLGFGNMNTTNLINEIIIQIILVKLFKISIIHSTYNQAVKKTPNFVATNNLHNFVLTNITR